MSDRLEHRLIYITKEDAGFKHLGGLVAAIKKHEKNEQYKNFVINEIDSWRKKRNTVVHEMAKIEKDKHKTWDEKIEFAEETALCGKELCAKMKREEAK